MLFSSLFPRRTGFIRFLALLVCFLFTLSFAAAQDQGRRSAVAQTSDRNQTANVKLTAHSLFQGYFKYGDWLPIEVNLENFGDTLDLQIEATITARINAANYRTTYRRETSLNERATKKVLLYIVPFVETTNPSRSIVYDTVITLNAGSRKLAEEKVNLQPVSPLDYLVGSITADANALNNLNNVKIGGTRYRVLNVNMPLSDIPDRQGGLRSFNALVISDINTEVLNAEQRNTLRDWVEAGGQLILSGGNGWSRVRSAFNATMLPLDVNNYTNITNLDKLVLPNGDILNSSPLTRPAILAQGTVLKDARLISYLQEGGNLLPVAAERRIGGGRVVGLGLDLAVAPLQEWSGSTQLWQDLFTYNLTPSNALYSETNPHLKNASEMLGLVSSVPELRLPDIMPFFGLLLAYLLLAGPVNYLVLKKLRRRELAWLTLPALTAIFTFTSLNYANSQPPGQVLISQMTVVQSGADQQTAQLFSYAAVFSPETRNYNISPGLANNETVTRTLITPLNRTNSGFGDGDPLRTVVQGDRPRLEDFEIGQWNSQGFAVETSISARPFQLTAELFYEDNKIVGTLRNNTGGPIRNSILLLGDTAQKFKDLIEPGEVVNVAFELPLQTAATQAFCSSNFSSSSTFTGSTPSERLANALLQDRRDDKVLAGRSNFLKKLYESGRYNPLHDQRGLDLVGWLEQNPLPLSVGRVTSQTKSNQVLIARLPVGLGASTGDKRFTLPATAIWPDTALTNTGLIAFSNRTDRTDQICLSKGSVTVQFRLPVEQGNLKINNMGLYLNAFTTNGNRVPTLPDSLEMYDYQAKTWQTLPGLTNSAVPVTTGSLFAAPPPPIRNPIEGSARFADPLTGRILLRMNYSSNSSTLLVQHGLEIEGTLN